MFEPQSKLLPFWDRGANPSPICAHSGTRVRTLVQLAEALGLGYEVLGVINGLVWPGVAWSGGDPPPPLYVLTYVVFLITHAETKGRRICINIYIPRCLYLHNPGIDV